MMERILLKQSKLDSKVSNNKNNEKREVENDTDIDATPDK